MSHLLTINAAQTLSRPLKSELSHCPYPLPELIGLLVGSYLTSCKVQEHVVERAWEAVYPHLLGMISTQVSNTGGR